LGCYIEKVVKEQFERDERIKLQVEREELARIERIRKQQYIMEI
jgi:hypothetical protein